MGFLIRAAVRETDYPARYGGDEFVVILPQTEREAARTLSEKLRELIEGHIFLQEEGINARLGVSIGVASYPDRGLHQGAAGPTRRPADVRGQGSARGGPMKESSGTL